MNEGSFRDKISGVLILIATPAFAQSEEPTKEQLFEQLKTLSERMEVLEAEHRNDAVRIAELEARLETLSAASIEAQRKEDIERIKEELRSERATPGPFDLTYGSNAPNALNPLITAFIDTGVSISSDGDNKALNRFNVREVELDFRAAITPSVDGVVIVALGEEIEQDLFGNVEISRAVELEEGYLNFHTLPADLAMKFGKFRNSFGRNNLLHTHDLPQVTRPLAVSAFFGHEGLSTTGASLSWLVPNPWDKYLETTIELVNADGGEESPILGGPNADNPAVAAHVKFFEDLTETSSLELGGSYLYTHTSANHDFDGHVFGLDVAYQWTDPDPSKFRSLLIQSELFWAHNDIDRGLFFSERNNSFGAYAFAQYQLHRDCYAGLRADYTEFPNSGSRGSDDWDVGLSPYVSWYITEFLRARLEYQHRFLRIDDGSGDEDAVFLQFTGVIGAHPPHPYWVTR